MTGRNLSRHTSKRSESIGGEICYLGIGANLGNRSENIKSAVKFVNLLAGTRVLKVSALIETEAEGGPSGQPLYLNGALKIRTHLQPAELLKELKKIERKLGRIRTVRHGPRRIDIDILLYGNKIVCLKGLCIPHLRMFERDFVLRPLLEVL